MIKFIKVKNVKSPEKSNPFDACYDFFVPTCFKEKPVFPNESISIESGIKIILPKGYGLVFLNKSGIAKNFKLIMGAQVIDYGYVGEIIINMINVGTDPVFIKPNMKITQGLIVPIFDMEMIEISLEEFKSIEKTLITNRYEKGFGSTGIYENN